MAYTQEDIIEKLNKALEQPENLYNCEVCNYRGSYNGVRYTEIAAAEILKRENLAKLYGIKSINRENYKVNSHEVLAQNEKPENSNQNEKWMAKKLYSQTLNEIGKIIDYQIPLKEARSDKTGEIDMLAHNQDNGKTYIVELKKDGSTETLLRCILEIFTYWQIVNKENLLHSYNLQGNALHKVIMTDSSSLAYKDLISENCGNVRQFMKELQVEFYLRDENDGRFIDI